MRYNGKNKSTTKRIKLVKSENQAMLMTIAGYQLTEQLYDSAHSMVYRGYREVDNLPVVLKVLKGDYPSPGTLAKFRREYEITRSLDIDGVIKVYSLEPYKNSLMLVLEDFGGESLLRIPQINVDMQRFLHLSIRITDILGKIHHRHIMHKDINPSNIVWNPSSDVLKIIDFGISTELSREKTDIRNPNVLEGTLAYMSPEQTGRMNRAMDYRTDFYSLGATFYYLLTGQLPFQTEDPMELVHCHLAKIPAMLYKLIEAASHGLQTSVHVISGIIMKLMAKNAEERYQSAYGLNVDLRHCLNQLEKTGVIKSFQIGQHDISSSFQLSQKLYGREHDIETLLNAFDRVAQGKTELMLLTGYSGIGKSALVHEIRSPVTEKQGYFISGKFDQFRRNIPYSAFIQAFQAFIRYLLTEPEGIIIQWKENFLDVLGPNGQVIIDVIPEVELIIGVQPAVPELPPTQAQNRFNFVFQKFVRACATAHHPLVIFLDDLQWADLSSLTLLELFTTDSIGKFMFIVGTYREHEVNDSHPLMFTLDSAYLTIQGVPSDWDGVEILEHK